QDEGFAGVFARATEILMQTLLEDRVRTWTTPPVYYIQPRVEHVTMFSFDHLREEVEEGYRATSAALERDDWPEPGDSGIYPKRRVLVRVERERCIGCGSCLVHGPQGMVVLDSDRKAVVTQPDQEWSPMDGSDIGHCPTYAIIARPAEQAKEVRRAPGAAAGDRHSARRCLDERDAESFRATFEAPRRPYVEIGRVVDRRQFSVGDPAEEAHGVAEAQLVAQLLELREPLARSND